MSPPDTGGESEPAADERDDDESALPEASGESTEDEEQDDGDEAAAHPESEGEPAAVGGVDAVAAAQTGEAETGKRKWLNKSLLWTVGGVFAAVALLVIGALTWQALNQDQKSVTQAQGTQIDKDPQNPALATCDDKETRFRVSFPANWGTQRVGGADVRLVAGPGNGNLMSVRVVSLDTGASGPPTPTSLKPYLDTIVNEPGVTMLQQNQITISNLPGWYYAYTFKDTASGATGVHNQYFIIRGNQLYSIVFQALPQSDFAALAPVYQQVVNSLQFY